MENKKGAMARMRQMRRSKGLMSLRRKELGITQHDMAKHLDVKQTTYMRYENGYVKPRNPETIEKIAKILNLDIDDLFGFLEVERPKINYNKSFSEIPLLNTKSGDKIIIDSDTDYPAIKREDILSDTNYIAISAPANAGRVRIGDTLFCREPQEPLKIGDLLVIETEQIITQQIVFEEVEKEQKIYQTSTLAQTAKNELLVDFGDGKLTKLEPTGNIKIYKVDYIGL